VSGQFQGLTPLRLAKILRYALKRRLWGPQSRYGRGDEEENPSPYRDSIPGRPARSLVTILTELAWLLLLKFRAISVRFFSKSSVQHCLSPLHPSRWGEATWCLTSAVQHASCCWCLFTLKTHAFLLLTPFRLSMALIQLYSQLSVHLETVSSICKLGSRHAVPTGLHCKLCNFIL
jgi:hypothetical protein